MVRTLTLEQWNHELVVNLIPNSAVLVVYLVLGLLGNGTVLFIYGRKFGVATDGRFFIPVLAITDIIACVVNCLGHLSEALLPVMYTSDIGCKTQRYLCMITTAISVFMLLLIAISRYIKICKPFRAKLSLKCKNISIIVIIVIAGLISLPFFLFVRSSEVKSEDGRLTGIRCAAVNSGKPVLAMTFKISLLVIILAVLTLVSILYFRIIRVIFTKANICAKEKTPRSARDDIRTAAGLRRMRNSMNNHEEGTSQPKDMDSLKQFKSANLLVDNFRITLIFIVITITFAVCFIPKVVIMVLESTNSNFWITPSDHELPKYMFLHSIYIFNNFINPVVYGFLDKKFQAELKKWCCFCP